MWSMDETLQNKRILVTIRNTRPDVLIVRYQDQSVQDEKAMLTGGRQGDLLELNVIRGGSVVYLPSYFLIPLHPTRDKQSVIALEGPHKGQAFKTMKRSDSPAFFDVSPIAVRKRKAVTTIESKQLVLFDQR